VKRRCKVAGIRGVRCSPHTFRHSTAIFALRNGMDVFSVQMLLGHASLAMTRRYCASLSAEDVAKKHRQFSPADNLPGRAKSLGGRKRLR